MTKKRGDRALPIPQGDMMPFSTELAPSYNFCVDFEKGSEKYTLPCYQL
ncbi:hypothetical protein [Moorena producens]